jgi:hypothetical protein
VTSCAFENAAVRDFVAHHNEAHDGNSGVMDILISFFEAVADYSIRRLDVVQSVAAADAGDNADEIAHSARKPFSHALIHALCDIHALFQPFQT